MSTVEPMPVGEWIDVWDVFRSEWISAIVIAKGKRIAICEDKEGLEEAVRLDCKWRYPPDPLAELEKRILSEWRTLDTPHDSFSDIPHQWLLEWMIKNGVSYETT